jgi:hypothetical protein
VKRLGGDAWRAGGVNHMSLTFVSILFALCLLQSGVCEQVHGDWRRCGVKPYVSLTFCISIPCFLLAMCLFGRFSAGKPKGPYESTLMICCCHHCCSRSWHLFPPHPAPINTTAIIPAHRTPSTPQAMLF